MSFILHVIPHHQHHPLGFFASCYSPCITEYLQSAELKCRNEEASQMFLPLLLPPWARDSRTLLWRNRVGSREKIVRCWHLGAPTKSCLLPNDVMEMAQLDNSQRGPWNVRSHSHVGGSSWSSESNASHRTKGTKETKTMQVAGEHNWCSPERW